MSDPQVDTSKKTVAVEAQFPEALGFLFEPYRYKVAYGGRGSGKSWAFARALLLQGVSQKLRIVCAREVQKTMKDSVHKLLGDQVQSLRLGSFYDVLETIIRGRNGTEIVFAGLSSQTAESIKSLEGCDRAWVEEAQTVSKNSWDILVPTIRKPNSEIWVTFNPVLESDPTYVKFVQHPPPNSKVAPVNYYLNPWFPDVLEQERLHCEATEDFDTYSNIWEGTCRAAVEGAIYAVQVAQATIEQRITFLPYDPNLKVHTIWDMGFADHMCVMFVQRSRHGVYCIDYEQQSGSTTQQVGALVKTRPYNWGRCFLPHDGFSKDRRASAGALTDAQILTKLGFKVKRIPKTSVEDRIKNGRAQFHRFVFDKGKCGELLECLKRYRRAESKHDIDTAPVHDEFSHGCLFAGEVVELERGMVPVEMVTIGDRVVLPSVGFGIVTASGISGVASKSVEVTCRNGKKLKVTPNHKMLTHKGIVLAGDLTYDHRILVKEGVIWKAIQLFLMEERTGLRETISLAMTNGNKPLDTFTGMSGLKQTVRYLEASISTTLMAIRKTMICPISKCFPSLTTFESMEGKAFGKKVIETSKMYLRQRGTYHMSQGESQKTEPEIQKGGRPTQNSTNGLEAKAHLSLLKKLKNQLRSGTHPKRARLGTQKMPKGCGPIKYLWKKSVKFVVPLILQLAASRLCTAGTIVKLKHEDVELQPVYNLTIEKHHCYLANGMLVSNSDTYGYAAQVIEEMINEDDGEMTRPISSLTFESFGSMGYVLAFFIIGFNNPFLLNCLS